MLKTRSWLQKRCTITEEVDRGYAYPFPPLLLSPAPSLISPGLPIHCPSSHNRRRQDRKNNIQVHSATSYLIFQYLQYWYNQYFPESSSICNTGITSIFQNLRVSAILVLPVFSRIFQYLQYWYCLYFPESSSICNTGITSISQNLPVSAILIFWQ